MSESAPPRLATMDDDGWTLLNAEERLARAENLYWLPDRWSREHLEEHVPENGHVKLMFLVFDPEHPKEPAIERMWVTLASREGDCYHGHLANAPHTKGKAHEGMAVWFRAEHVIDFAGPNGEAQATETAEAVRCHQHGVSLKCYVCEHLTPDSEGRGFHAADTEDVRPDAWCDECHQEFMRAESWEAPGTREPTIKLVCGGCYDALKVRHQH